MKKKEIIVNFLITPRSFVKRLWFRANKSSQSNKEKKLWKQPTKTLKNSCKFYSSSSYIEKKSRAYFYLKCLCFFLINLECSSIGYQSSRFWWRWSDSISRHNNGDNTRQHISSRYKWIVKNLLSIVVMWCVVFV